MARPTPSLSNELASYLNTQVYISRSLRLFHITDLTKTWGISIATIHRYKSPAYREASRIHARKAAMAYKQRRDLVNCSVGRCRKEIKTHMRCFDCTILLHKDEDIPRLMCQSCVDSRAWRILRNPSSKYVKTLSQDSEAFAIVLLRRAG